MTNPAPPAQDPNLPTAGYFDGREHVLPFRIYYEDTDFSGVVYHANYLRFFERGRSDFLRLAGVHHADLANREAPSGFAVAAMELEFKKPARIDDALLVRTRHTGSRGPRLFFSQKVWRDGDLICAAKVTATAIYLDGRIKRPSPEEKAVWAGFEWRDGA
ncbi:MAG: YbgC/FadM family acyl-CoA thioesterase [Pseudomonadota bacterium]